MDLLELIVAVLNVLLSTLNLIIYKNKHGLIRLIISVFCLGGYFCFRYIAYLSEYSWIYDVVALGILVYVSIFFMPKKITKNITEYDYFELEKAYDDVRHEKENLRQRYLSTVGLIDEGIIFYENGMEDVILSDKALEMFGGKQARSFVKHLESIIEEDRNEYKRAIDKISKSASTYEVKYRIYKQGKAAWVLERGNYIGVERKKSIIATCRLLDLNTFKSTAYFDVDSLYREENMYPEIKNLLSERKPFSLIVFELSNVPTLNQKYGREIGNLMMNDYIRFLKSTFQKDISKMFRITGVRYAMIIDDERTYQDFHRALVQPGSTIYSLKISVAGTKDYIEPNFGVVNVSGSGTTDSLQIFKIATKSLEEAINSSRRNYSIFGE